MRFLLAPLEIPKLANAQPSNFGPLPCFINGFGPWYLTQLFIELSRNLLSSHVQNWNMIIWLSMPLPSTYIVVSTEPKRYFPENITQPNPFLTMLESCSSVPKCQFFFSCPNGSKLNFNRKKITDIFWNFEFPTRFSSDFHFSHPSFCLWVAKFEDSWKPPLKGVCRGNYITTKPWCCGFFHKES